MARLEIQNFGAIKHAEINIKKYNIFIGETSSGKSTVAKLLTIFNTPAFWAIGNGSLNMFHSLLDKYNINFKFESNSEIHYTSDSYYWIIKKDSFNTNYEDTDLLDLAQSQKSDAFIEKFIEKKSENKTYKNLIKSIKELYTAGVNSGVDSTVLMQFLLPFVYDKCTPVYIPAERLLISMFSNNIFSLLTKGVNIPECIKEFGSLYENARKHEGNIDINFLNIHVTFSDEGDMIFLKEETKEIKLKQTSSGIQSLIPLWAVFNQFVKSKEKQIIVIEEPELNLFPSTQSKLIEQIMGRMRKSEGSVVLTTHSPYILASIDNFILANEIRVKNNNTKDILSKIKEISPSLPFVNFEEVSSYYFPHNGEVFDIIDKEMKSVGAEHIDDASNVSSRIFNELCYLDE